MAEEQLSEKEEDMLSESEEDQDPLTALITTEVWNMILKDVNIRKQDLNMLVMNFLVVQGHRQVAENFQKESGTIPQVDLASITDRLAVIQAIQRGHIEDAAEKLNALNPEVLKTNFMIHQQRLIELIRENKINEAFAFAGDKLTPFVTENEEAYLEELENTIVILGYEDPLTCPRSRDLLDKSRWFKTASDVNEALLASQAGEKGPKLHSLLKMLVWTQNQLDELAVYPRMSICPLASS